MLEGCDTYFGDSDFKKVYKPLHDLPLDQKLKSIQIIHD